MTERNPDEVLELVASEGVEIVDFRFCDLPGLMQHFSVPAHQLTADAFEEGYGFDGSSIRGFQEIQESDMILMPDPNTAVIDPFMRHKTLILNCFVRDPVTGESYTRDPRYIAQKAEEHLRSTGIADTAYFGPEAEFYVFNDVRFSQDQRSAFYQVDSVEGSWNTAKDEGPNLGYKPRYKEGYFPVPPMDHFQDLRSEMVLTMEQLGIEIEVQHHEVGTAGQAEIDMRFDTLLVMADKLMLYKYIVKNVARKNGLSATFMPKPIFQDNGSGMHVHQSLWQGDEPLFFDEIGYAGLSDMARWYIGGLLSPRSGDPRFRRADDEQLQAAGARLRGAGQPRLQPAQPLGLRAHPAVLDEPQGQAPRVPLPGSVGQPVPGLPRHADGRPRWHRQQDGAAGPGRQGPLRPAARGAEEGAAGAGLTRRVARRAGGRQRLPQGWGCLHGRPHRDVDRLQAGQRDRRGASPPAPLGVPPVLRHLSSEGGKETFPPSDPPI